MTEKAFVHRITLGGGLARVFPMFTPLGERAWAPGWSPEFLDPQGGRTREGIVFRTGDGRDETLWTCTEWRPAEHRVRYVRVSSATRFGFVNVACRQLEPGRTEAEVGYRFVALNPDGEAWLEGFTAEVFVEMIEGWRPLVDAWLEAHPGETVAH